MTSDWRFDAIGTVWTIGTPDPVAPGVRAAITARIDAFDRTWSRFRTDALVHELRTRREIDLGADAPAILAIYDRLFALTAGAVSPLVGSVLEQLGYGAGYTLTPAGEPVRIPSWTDCELVGTVLHVPGPVVLDIGAVGKGFLAGAVAAMIDQPCVVDASGDLVNHSGRSLCVALEDPDDSGLALGVVEVPDGEALCGSATNRRRWADDLHHVLDARSGRPIRDVVATWAGGPDAAWADGLATAAFFTDDLSVAGHWSAALHGDRRLVARHFPGEVFG